jgi:hypothetical protein
MFKVKSAGGFRRVFLGLLCVLFCACAGTPGKSGSRPDWVSDPYKVYNKAVYIAAVGYGPARADAEKNALAALTSIFGQSVSSETITTYSYSQALVTSGSVWAENSDIAQAVKTSVAMNTLIGAEIKDVWDDRNGTSYAVAAMERAKTNLIYSEMIQTNLNTINNLTKLPAAETRSFEAYGRYRKAASIADANAVLVNVMKVISPGSMAGEQFKTGDDYRLEASEIAKNIPVQVIIANDRQTRIKSAFSQVLSDGGFRTGGTGSRYVLSGSLVLEEVSYPGNPNKFVRYSINADLVDTSSGTTLFPYAISSREGHAIVSEAENRALRAAENEIKKSYVNALGDFLSMNSAGGSK